MTARARFSCHGCGAAVDAARALPFACPNAGANDDVDHVLVAPAFGGEIGDEDNPFLRYRHWLSPYRLALEVGLGDEFYVDITGELDAALQRVDGRGFRLTPFSRQPALAQALGLAGDLWVKDETQNVAGSHKARHLMGAMLYLLTRQRADGNDDLRRRRLAIASCGNAALAAATMARAADWPIDVFIPTDAERHVVRRLNDLGAGIVVCERRAGERGDPCVTAARAAVKKGALPFSVQGPDNGLAVEGVRTLAFEMAETLAAEGAEVEALYVQVGGGALASALAQGFAIAAAAGLVWRPPRLFAVQTAGCAPLARAWARFEKVDASEAVARRSTFMWPWETVPASLAHGILDDETYDWFEIVKAMRATDGGSIVADEAAVAQALALSREHTGVKASATGAAGLAGLIAKPGAARSAAAVLSGVDHD